MTKEQYRALKKTAAEAQLAIDQLETSLILMKLGQWWEDAIASQQYSNGDLDPWSSGGVTWINSSAPIDSVSFMIHDGAHHLDLISI